MFIDSQVKTMTTEMKAGRITLIERLPVNLSKYADILEPTAVAVKMQTMIIWNGSRMKISRCSVATVKHIIILKMTLTRVLMLMKYLKEVAEFSGDFERDIV